MGIVIRQSIFSTIISYAGVAIGYVNLLYLYPKYLSPDQVGLFRTIQDAAILFSPFAQLGLTQSIYRFYPQFAKDNATSQAFATLMLTLALGGFLVFFGVFKLFETELLFYFAENAPQLGNYATVVVWLTLILVLIAAFEAYSRSLLKTIIPNLIREVVIRLLLGVLVLLYFAGWLNFHQFIVGSVVIYASCLMILFLYLWTQANLKINLRFGILDQTKLTPLIRYSLLSFAGMAGMILIGKMDSMMVTAMVGLTANAVYTTAFYIATVIEIPKRALSQVAMPLISRAFEKNDLLDIQQIYKKTAINQLIIGSLLLIGIYANLDSIFMMMPKREIYEAGKWVVIIVGAGKLIDMAFGPSSEIIVLSKYYWFNILLILLLAGSLIGANNVLIPRYGIAGAAYGTAFALFLFNAVKFIYLKVKLDMQPLTLATVKVLIICALTLGLNFILPKVPIVLVDIAYRSVLITLVFGGLVYLSNASPDANEIFRKALKVLKLV